MEQSNETSMLIADDGYMMPAAGWSTSTAELFDSIDSTSDGVGPGSIGIGMDAGYPHLHGGARGAELLQLFIENL